MIRLKVVQLIYEHHIKCISAPEEPQNIAIEKMTRKLLDVCLADSYKLYQYLLLLLVDLHRTAEKQVEAAIQRANRLHSAEQPSRRLIDNPFILQLSDNEQLKAFRNNDEWTWMTEEKFLLRTYQHIVQTDYYKKYMQTAAPTYRDHKEVWQQIYADCFCNCEFIDSLLEDRGLYWNDDKYFIDSFVLKTIRTFKADASPSQPLMSDFHNDADREFAIGLLEAAVKGAEGYKAIIAKHLQPGWDMERIATMDSVIMQVALAEITNFPDIPLRVSINEYINIAKDYSTPNSGAYVNGMLDAMAKSIGGK